jgi:hypothetical protein
VRTDRSFDRVLLAAQEQERARLRRYRRRWILRQVAVLVVASAVLAMSVPALVGSEAELAPLSVVTFFLVGGWIGFMGIVGLAGVAVLAMLLAVFRLAAVLRSDDVAAFERTHAPWWSDAPR